MSSGITWGKPHSALSERDRAVVEMVGQFRQLTAGHIAEALFSENASRTPCDRALKRLVAQRYLARLDRATGGGDGGSSQYVYQLGRQGWRLLGRAGSYWAARTANYHSLAIADCFVALRRAEQHGVLRLLRFDNEPMCHRTVSSVRLTPDAYVEVGLRDRGMKFGLWLEVDLGSERGGVILEKCQRYWRAYKAWLDGFFPYIVFVTPDEKRYQELNRIMRTTPEVARALFRVVEAPGSLEVLCNRL